MTVSPKLMATMSWLRQTSTILGTATLVGTLAEALQHQLAWGAAAPIMASAVVAIAWPGHPDANATVAKAVSDGFAVAQSKGGMASVTTLGTDLVTMAGMLPDNTPVVAVQHTVTPIAPSAVSAVPIAAPMAPAAPVPATVS